MSWVSRRYRPINATNGRTWLINTEDSPPRVRSRMAIDMIRPKAIPKIVPQCRPSRRQSFVQNRTELIVLVSTQKTNRDKPLARLGNTDPRCIDNALGNAIARSGKHLHRLNIRLGVVGHCHILHNKKTRGKIANDCGVVPRQASPRTFASFSSAGEILARRTPYNTIYLPLVLTQALETPIEVRQVEQLGIIFVVFAIRINRNFPIVKSAQIVIASRCEPCS